MLKLCAKLWRQPSRPAEPGEYVRICTAWKQVVPVHHDATDSDAEGILRKPEIWHEDEGAISRHREIPSGFAKLTFASGIMSSSRCARWAHCSGALTPSVRQHSPSFSRTILISMTLIQSSRIFSSLAACSSGRHCGFSSEERAGLLEDTEVRLTPRLIGREGEGSHGRLLLPTLLNGRKTVVLVSLDRKEMGAAAQASPARRSRWPTSTRRRDLASRQRSSWHRSSSYLPAGRRQAWLKCLDLSGWMRQKYSRPPRGIHLRLASGTSMEQLASEPCKLLSSA